ncbi:hypothetical protein H0H87_002087 [Tephrocybe sp. NHM501043]|nr:hypothetical protein H0H87_002087 [Tephrocybe sp. NHM501043]
MQRGSSTMCMTSPIPHPRHPPIGGTLSKCGTTQWVVLNDTRRRPVSFARISLFHHPRDPPLYPQYTPDVSLVKAAKKAYEYILETVVVDDGDADDGGFTNLSPGNHLEQEIGDMVVDKPSGEENVVFTGGAGRKEDDDEEDDDKEDNKEEEEDVALMREPAFEAIKVSLVDQTVLAVSLLLQYFTQLK